MSTANDICANAMLEIGALAPGESPSGDEIQTVFAKLNRMLDSWTAQKRFVYAWKLTAYNIIPNHQPHTIGQVAADFNDVRPVSIDNANLILTNVTPVVRTPIKIRDKDWWAAQRVQGITSSVPTDMYYRATYPNGSIYLWPVPTTAYQLEIESRVQISGFVNLTDSFSFPPGYEDAVTYSLAEALCPSFEKQLRPDLMQLAKNARAVITSNNSKSPALNLQDAGLPTGGKTNSDFNYLTGGFR